MKRPFKKIGLICTVLVFSPFIFSFPLQVNQQQLIKATTQNNVVSPNNNEELLKPSNWIARGGCWDFSSKNFFSRGYRGGNIAYYKKQDYKNFTYEVKVMKIAEDGPLGIIFRYDDARDEGYVFAVMPHGEYFLSTFIGQSDVYLKRGATAHLNEEMNTWNTLKIVVNGAKFDCYINGSFLVSVTDQTYSVGKIGLCNSPDPRQIAKFEVISLIEH
jgi:hypothetical protein